MNMTGPSEVPNGKPLMLIDEYEDGCVESHAWVEKGDACDSAEKAVKVVESEYPIEDRGEEEIYVATGATQWMRPHDPAGWNVHYEGGWDECGPDDEDAREFWIVSVVCAA